MKHLHLFVPLSLRIFGVCVLLVVASLPAAAQDGEATAEPNELSIYDDFYNHETGWHVYIPSGWTNASTADYARFTDSGRTIHATAFTNDVTSMDAIERAVSSAFPTLNVTLIDARDVNLINGIWTQHVYRTDNGYLTAHAQVYENAVYVLLYAGGADAVPLIVIQDGAGENADAARAAVSAAVRAIIAGLDEPTDTAETVTESGATIFTQTFERDGAIYTALGRARGNAVYVVAGTGDLQALDAASVYFTSLNDFFITPNTTPYLILGIVLSAVIGGIVVLSLIVRRQSLLKDEATLRQLEADTMQSS